MSTDKQYDPLNLLYTAALGAAFVMFIAVIGMKDLDLPLSLAVVFLAPAIPLLVYVVGKNLLIDYESIRRFRESPIDRFIDSYSSLLVFVAIVLLFAHVSRWAGSACAIAGLLVLYLFGRVQEQAIRIQEEKNEAARRAQKQTE